VTSKRLAAVATALLVLPGCGVPEYRAFGNPERVAIRGYDGDAMEPFVTPDGRYLLFNNRNDPRIDTNLHFARRIDSLTYQYGGALKGANTPALEGVPSVDRAGNLFFVSTRSYRETLATLYRGRFVDGTVADVRLVGGVSRRQPGIVMFDAEIAADGNTLFVVDGEFSGGPQPRSADIAIAVRDGAEFRRVAASAELLKNVNTAALEYAPAVSSDLRELFFTRATGSGPPAIFRTERASAAEPFESPQRVGAIAGFVEAPALPGDGRSLYYHKLEGGRFLIYRVSRP
jgi:hypothetical protein